MKLSDLLESFKKIINTPLSNTDFNIVLSKIKSHPDYQEGILDGIYKQTSDWLFGGADFSALNKIFRGSYIGIYR